MYSEINFDSCLFILSFNAHSTVPICRSLIIQLFRKVPFLLQQMTQLLQHISNFAFFQNQIQSPLTFSGTKGGEQDS